MKTTMKGAQMSVQVRRPGFAGAAVIDSISPGGALAGVEQVQKAAKQQDRLDFSEKTSSLVNALPNTNYPLGKFRYEHTDDHIRIYAFIPGDRLG
jgi:hypothetical protein